MVVGNQHQINRRHVCYRQGRRCVTLRPDQLKGAGAFRQYRVGEHVQTTILEQERGVTQPDQLWFFGRIHQGMRIWPQQREAFSLREVAARGQLPAHKIANAMSGDWLQVAVPAPIEMRFRSESGKAITVNGHGSNSHSCQGPMPVAPATCCSLIPRCRHPGNGNRAC